jgi:hypothetical protein
VKDQLICAKGGLRYLFQNIKQLQVYHGFAVVFFWMSIYEILCAKEGLRYLFQNIKQLQVYHGFAVVFSGCLYMKSSIINERIDELNKYMYSMRRQCEYYSVDHSNIPVHFLKDQVHMNAMGEKMFLNNMKGFV